MYFNFEEDKIYENDEVNESLIYDEEDTRYDTGFYQSPVNLNSRDAVYRPLDIHKPLEFRYMECRECVLQNTGRAARVIFQHPTGSSNDSQYSYKSYIIGGPLLDDARYKLSEMYFHWGKDDTVGSEHTVNNTAFPMEIQLIHWNSTHYHCVDEAATGEHGLVIVTIFIQVGRSHEELEKLIDNFWAIQYKGQSKVISATFNPSCLLPHPSLRDYWTYSGSLTWPPFSENVEWILLRYPLTVSHKQLYEFRRLKKNVKHDLTAETRHEDLLFNNFRPLQPLNGRTIWASFES